MACRAKQSAFSGPVCRGTKRKSRVFRLFRATTRQSFSALQTVWRRAGGFEPPVQVLTVQRFSNSQEGSDQFRKFSTVPDSSMTYQHRVLSCSDPFCAILSIGLLQFYYSPQNRKGAVLSWEKNTRVVLGGQDCCSMFGSSDANAKILACLVANLVP